jgi:hypothetical protein
MIKRWRAPGHDDTPNKIDDGDANEPQRLKNQAWMGVKTLGCHIDFYCLQ